MAALGAVRFGLSFARRFGAGRLGIDVEYDMRNDIYDHLHRLDFARHDEMQSGQLVSRANSDVRVVQMLLGFLPFMSGNLLLFILSLTFMVALSPPLTAVALVTVPVLMAMAVRMRTVVYPSSWDAQQRAAELAGVVEEATSGVRVVKGFGQERRELAKLREAGVALFGARMRNARISARRQTAMQLVPALAQVAVFAFGGWLAMEGRISLGTLLAFQTYLLQLIAPVRQLAGMTVMASTARAAAERIFELLDATSEVVERPGARALGPVRGEVVFEGVRFGYLRAEPVVDGFDLRVAPGEVVALVGASGSGKSTASLLLPRFYDVQAGAVRIDGVDVRDVTLDSLRREIGVVFEDSFLFSDTIRANLSYGRPDASDAEVERAARVGPGARLHRRPARRLRHRGRRAGAHPLGGPAPAHRPRPGAAHRPAGAPARRRHLVGRRAHGGGDPRHPAPGDAGRTTILVAHRRSTLHLADRIAVLDGGRVADTGTHDELTARCALYRRLLGGPDDDIDAVADAGIDAVIDDAIDIDIDAVADDDIDAAGPADPAAADDARPVAGVTASAWRPATPRP